MMNFNRNFQVMLQFYVNQYGGDVKLRYYLAESKYFFKYEKHT